MVAGFLCAMFGSRMRMLTTCLLSMDPLMRFNRVLINVRISDHY